MNVLVKADIMFIAGTDTKSTSSASSNNDAFGGWSTPSIRAGRRVAVNAATKSRDYENKQILHHGEYPPGSLRPLYYFAENRHKNPDHYQTEYKSAQKQHQRDAGICNSIIKILFHFT